MAPSRRAVAMACRPGDADAHDERLGRRHGARRRHHHRHRLAEVRGGIDHRLVAGEVGLAGQHVHRLRARDARHELHRHQRRAGAGQRLEAGPVVEGRQHGRHDGAGLQGLHLLAGGPAHLEQNVGPAQRLGGAGGDGRALRLQDVVGKARVRTGTRLHPHRAAERGELLDGFRRHGHAGLAIAFRRNGNRDHDGSPRYAPAGNRRVILAPSRRPARRLRVRGSAGTAGRRRQNTTRMTVALQEARIGPHVLRIVHGRMSAGRIDSHDAPLRFSDFDAALVSQACCASKRRPLRAVRHMCAGTVHSTASTARQRSAATARHAHCGWIPLGASLGGNDKAAGASLGRAGVLQLCRQTARTEKRPWTSA